MEDKQDLLRFIANSKYNDFISIVTEINEYIESEDDYFDVFFLLIAKDDIQNHIALDAKENNDFSIIDSDLCELELLRTLVDNKIKLLKELKDV